MDRRTFLSTLAGGLVAAPLATGAQQVARPTIGILDLGSAASRRPVWAAFREGLRERGYIEGENIAIEYRSANEHTDRLPALAAELLAMKVTVIVATGTTTIQAAKDSTKTTPIVIAAGADPVEMGFAQSLARPGGNITGLSILGSDMIQKRLELLRQTVPQAKTAAFLLQGANPGNPVFVRAITNAAPALGLRIHVVQVRNVSELDGAFTGMVRAKADALMVIEDPVFVTNAKRIADLALHHRFPTILGNRLYVTAGGLMAYGLVSEDLYRRAAFFVDRILKGAKPADMPIEQPTRFELVINMKTAKTIGLTISPSLLQRADHVIE